MWIKEVVGWISMLSCAQKTTFDECNFFWDFDVEKFIVYFFENEKGVKDLVDILVFILQVAKKENNYIFL